MKKDTTHNNHRSRMRTKFQKSGFSSFSDIEVLEFILFYAIPRVNTNPIAHRLLEQFGSLSSVFSADVSALKQIDGIGDNAAYLLSSFSKLKARIILDSKKRFPIVNSIQAKQYCSTIYPDFDKEHFFVVCLDGSNKVIARKLIQSGTLTRINVKVREITKFTLQNQCNRIIISHCHTGYSSNPSDVDLNFTQLIICSCLINDIDVVDHIIVCPNGASSMAELHFLNPIKKIAYEKMPVEKTKEKDKNKELTENDFASEDYAVITN